MTLAVRRALKAAGVMFIDENGDLTSLCNRRTAKRVNGRNETVMSEMWRLQCRSMRLRRLPLSPKLHVCEDYHELELVRCQIGRVRRLCEVRATLPSRRSKSSGRSRLAMKMSFARTSPSKRVSNLGSQIPGERRCSQPVASSIAAANGVVDLAVAGATS
jgi:hypothetical protein